MKVCETIRLAVRRNCEPLRLAGFLGELPSASVLSTTLGGQSVCPIESRLEAPLTAFQEDPSILVRAGGAALPGDWRRSAGWRAVALDWQP